MNIVKLQDIKSTQKSLAFLYTNNEKVEKEIKENYSLQITDLGSAFENKLK